MPTGRVKFFNTDRGFGFKLPRGVRQATPIRPPLVVQCAQMAAIKMRQLVNKSCISRFGRKVRIQQQRIPWWHKCQGSVKTSYTVLS